MATLIVFLSHSIGFYDYSTLSKFIFFDGAADVILFFILSGFNLSYKYFGKLEMEIRVFPYLYRRFYRLYPTYILGLILVLILRNYFNIPNMFVNLNVWINSQ